VVTFLPENNPMTLPLTFNIPSSTDHVWSVGQLSASVKRLIEGHPMPLWVQSVVEWALVLHAARQAESGEVLHVEAVHG
jgi:hypothetical protein